MALTEGGVVASSLKRLAFGETATSMATSRSNNSTHASDLTSTLEKRGMPPVGTKRTSRAGLTMSGDGGRPEVAGGAVCLIDE